MHNINNVNVMTSHSLLLQETALDHTYILHKSDIKIMITTIYFHAQNNLGEDWSTFDKLVNAFCEKKEYLPCISFGIFGLKLVLSVNILFPNVTQKLCT